MVTRHESGTSRDLNSRRNRGRIRCLMKSATGVIIGMFLAGASVAGGAEPLRELGTVSTKRLTEISGLAASRQNPGILWMHNDGAAKEVFAVKLNGQLAARFKFDVDVEDLEDIAIGPGPVAGIDYLYLGDIGDNSQTRREIRVIRFPEPSIDKDRALKDVETFRLAYPDAAFDAEALMVDPLTRDVYIMTKERRRARLYVARADSLREGALVPLERVAVLRLDRVTGGDISRDGSLLLLRNKEQGWLWRRRSEERLEAALARSPQLVPVRCGSQGEQGEAVAFHPSGGGYYTISEGERESICVFGVRPVRGR
jgi:hypothetical protein